MPPIKESVYLRIWVTFYDQLSATHKINYCKQTTEDMLNQYIWVIVCPIIVILIYDGRLDFIKNKVFKFGCIDDKCKDDLTYECLKKED